MYHIKYMVVNFKQYVYSLIFPMYILLQIHNYSFFIVVWKQLYESTRH